MSIMWNEKRIYYSNYDNVPHAPLIVNVRHKIFGFEII